MPAATDRRPAAVIASANTPALDWDGKELEPFEESYDDYLESMPSREALRPYQEPVYYWEVRYPGCTLQPYPRMGGFNSSPEGLWGPRNRAQEDAVRDYITNTARVDPDVLKLTPDEVAYQTGDKVPPQGGTRFCQDAGCRFITTSLVASGLHEELTGHTTKAKPPART